ncbi:TetR/AcrR family transcriptional regulator [Nocardia arizonensis]|uniref:TetR/AcrR family transcriptional regulator n=1 Tax=Nocardia arizonensis TaxID=1141647 RepID=UPI0006D28220|nr:TetR/AcrR family transcriptional regulator [Nocardia arizonensis]
MDSTRNRIVAEALRLFAEQGYASTSVAAIEEAAGLSPRSGALYTHFGSKQQVLAAAVEAAVELAETGFALAPMFPLGDLRAELVLVGRGSLLLMSNWRNLIRVMIKESDQFPEVMVQARERLFSPAYEYLAGWLTERAAEEHLPEQDFEALTTIWLGAIENYWVMSNIHHHSPFGMTDDRFIDGWVDSLMTTLGAKP